MKSILTFLLFIAFVDLNAQVVDDFSDGDFTNNPFWSGSTAFFQVNADQLQSNGPAATSSLFLSTPNTQFAGMQWEFYVNLAFNPSDANQARIYLMSDQADLSSPLLNGYFIRMGENGTADGIDLWKQVGTSFTKIIDGLAGSVAVNPAVRIRVIRDVVGNWLVYADTTGGRDFTLQGSTFDEDISVTTHFGFVCLHTTTNRQRFFFDDVSIQPAPISATQAEALTATQIAVQFSREPTSASVSDLANYEIDQNIGIASAKVDEKDASRAILSLSTPLVAFTTYTLSVKAIRDADNNVIETTTLPFTYVATAQSNDLVITEILADETPGVGLPATEFIEIYNRSNQPLSLHQFRLLDDNGTGIFPNVILGSHEYLIVCAHAAVSNFTALGKAVGLANFSLNNTGEMLSLRDPKGRLISSVRYSDVWYHSQMKKEGGWSLEMIDLDNPCGEESNWTASESPKGGTPGQVNSVKASKPDLTPPQLTAITVINDHQFWAVFDEKLDSTSASSILGYRIDNNANVKAVSVASPDFKRVQITLLAALQAQTMYTFVATNLRDCNGNLASKVSLPFVLPQQGDSTDVVLNEVLFNPLSGGVDFVELYNRSSKYVSLAGWQLANLEDGNIANAKIITQENTVLAPQQYLLLTTNLALIKSQYPKAKVESGFQMTSFPSLSDESGNVVLLNNLNKAMDRFDYHEDMHFPLLKDKSGVSLEKIGFEAPSNDPKLRGI